MSRTPISVISRLRRRLATAVWLFALIMAGQNALAMRCFTDGLTGAAQASAVASEAHASPSIDSAASHDAPCWHAGAGGCHCTCAHASGLPIVAYAWRADRIGAAKAVTRAIAPYSAPLSASLRPPIA